MLKLFSLIAVVLFVLLGIVVGLLNPVAVELNLFFLSANLPLSVIMSALLVLGMAIGGLVVFLQVLKLRWIIHAKVRDNQKLSDQIIQLKKAQIETKENRAKSRVEALPEKNT